MLLTLCPDPPGMIVLVNYLFADELEQMLD